MTTDEAEPTAKVAVEARFLVRNALTAALATIDGDTGHPYASLITVASNAGGEPLFLISKLARHTQNIERDPRASILFEAEESNGDPLAKGRVSLFGRVEISDDSSTRNRFLRRHPTAEAYSDFADFAFYRLATEGAHFVGGFGRIHELEPSHLLIETGNAAELIEAENRIVDHMNEDHADAIELYATKLLGVGGGAWRMTGCDPEGCDLFLDGRSARLTFPSRVTNPTEIRETLVALVKQARNS